MIPLLQTEAGLNALTIVSLTINASIVPASIFYHNFVIKPIKESVDKLILKDQSHDARITEINEEIIRKSAEVQLMRREIELKNNMTAMLKETLETLPKFNKEA